MSPNLGLSIVFLMVRLDLRVLGKITTEVKGLSRHTILEGTYNPHDLTVDVNCHHILWLVFTKFLHCKVNHFSLYLLSSLKVTFLLLFGTESLSPAHHTQGEGN